MNAAWFFVPFEFYPIDREGRSIEPISPPNCNFFPPPTAWNDLFFETFYAPAIRLSSNASIGKKFQIDDILLSRIIRIIVSLECSTSFHRI